MIAKLSEMLRYSLDSSEKEQVTVAEELNFVQTYLDLEQQRLGNRMNVSVDVDKKIMDLPVPPMIVQPLVENAVKHGIAPLEEGGDLQIAVKQKNESVTFVIEDNGKGMPSNFKENQKSIGLKNTNSMLVKRFGESHRLQIETGNPRGTKVTFSIPI